MAVMANLRAYAFPPPLGTDGKGAKAKGSKVPSPQDAAAASAPSALHAVLSPSPLDGCAEAHAQDACREPTQHLLEV